MIPCLDIHTHHPAPQPLGVISASLSDFNPVEGQKYSLGIHPWTSNELPSAQEWQRFEELAALPCVVAIGECGVDILKGGPMYKQLIIFNRQIDIAEKLGKPMIVHDVKAHDVVIGMKRDLKPKQNWAIHGFRYKPTVAKMFTDAGVYLSFGENFNAETPGSVPPHLLLAETDESNLDIKEIIAGLSANLDKDVTQLIEINTRNFLNIENKIEI